MTQEKMNNNEQDKSFNSNRVNFGKKTMSGITKFLSEIIKENKTNKESRGNFLKNEQKKDEEK